MFSQLLDGHSQLQAHPHELFIGKPNKWNWPELPLHSTSERIFDLLREPKIAALGESGNFVKPGSNQLARRQIVPFTYDIDEHKRLFSDSWNQQSWPTQRFAIQLYLSTFFQAWPEHFSTGREHYVSCFLPHILLHEDSVDRLLNDFPDVFLVNLIRSPIHWLASVSRHISLDLNDQAGVIQNLNRWKKNVLKILQISEAGLLHVYATSYEALVLDTDSQMHRFCENAGINFEEVLRRPTVGGFPVLPNSSYPRHDNTVNVDSLKLSVNMPDYVQPLMNDVYLPVYLDACNKLDIPVSHPMITSSYHPNSYAPSSTVQTYTALSTQKIKLSLEKNLNFSLVQASKSVPVDAPFPCVEISQILSPELFNAVNIFFPSIAQMSSMPVSRTANIYAQKYRNLFTLSSDNLKSLSEKSSRFWGFFKVFAQELGWILYEALPTHKDDVEYVRCTRGDIKVRVDLWSDLGGYQVSPHTDAPHKKATFLIYCSTEQTFRGEGTSLYKPLDENMKCWKGIQHPFENFREIYTTEYASNKVFGFLKTDNSFHGKKPTMTFDSPRKTIALTIQSKNDFVA